MEEKDNAWREIQALIARDKAAALEEFRRRPLPLAEGPLLQKEARFRFRTAALVAASLLLVAALAALWLVQGGWRGDPLEPAAGALLVDSYLYAAAGQADAAAGGGLPGGSSPYFTALAEIALRPRAIGQADAGAAARAAVERGDPEEVRRAIVNAIRENAFERALHQIQQIHAQEA